MLRLEIAGEPIRFVSVSDITVRIPIIELTVIREASEAYLYYAGGRISAKEVFIGSGAEVRTNLMW